MLKNLIEQNMTLMIGAITLLLLVLIIFKIWKFYRITDLDKNYKKVDDKENVIQCGRTRNIWDYHFFPGLSRLWHQGEWQVAGAASLILVFIFLWLYTRNDTILNMIGINFGVVIGMMLEKQRKQKKDK